LIQLLRSLFGQRRLLLGFVARDLKARYVGSAMGFFWSVIFPILNLFVYMFVFRLVLNTRFHDGAGIKDVAIWMLAGITVWSAFGETVSRSTNCLVENSNLIQKVVFPSEILPAYLTISALVNMCIGIPVVLLGVLWFAYLGPEPVHALAAAAAPAAPAQGIQVAPREMGVGLSLVSLPLLLCAQGVFTLGLGYLLSTLNLYLRDTYHLIGVALTVWMFATPIFYPAVMVEQTPLGEPSGYGWILAINPMHWLIECYRDVLVFGDWPDWGRLGRYACVAAATFVFGGWFFMSQKKAFPDLL
jgi:ABC-type polysaccharide/polyol phosphate export permease